MAEDAVVGIRLRLEDREALSSLGRFLRALFGFGEAAKEAAEHVQQLGLSQDDLARSSAQIQESLNFGDTSLSDLPKQLDAIAPSAAEVAAQLEKVATVGGNKILADLEAGSVVDAASAVRDLNNALDETKDKTVGEEAASDLGTLAQEAGLATEAVDGLAKAGERLDVFSDTGAAAPPVVDVADTEAAVSSIRDIQSALEGLGAGAEEAGAAIDTSLGGALSELPGAVSELSDPLADLARRLADAFGGDFDQILSGLKKGAQAIAKDVGATFDDAAQGLTEGLQEELSASIDAIKEAQSVLDSLSPKEAAQRLQDLGFNAAEIAKSFSKLSDETSSANEALSSVDASTKATSAATAELSERAQSLIKLFRGVSQEYVALVAAQDPALANELREIGILKETVTALEEVSESRQRLQELVEAQNEAMSRSASTSPFEQVSDSLRDIQDAAEHSRKELDILGDARLESLSKEAGDVADKFKALDETLGTDFKSLDATLEGTVNQLAKLGVEISTKFGVSLEAVTNLLANEFKLALTDAGVTGEEVAQKFEQLGPAILEAAEAIKQVSLAGQKDIGDLGGPQVKALEKTASSAAAGFASLTSNVDDVTKSLAKSAHVVSNNFGVSLERASEFLAGRFLGNLSQLGVSSQVIENNFRNLGPTISAAAAQLTAAGNSAGGAAGRFNLFGLACKKLVGPLAAVVGGIFSVTAALRFLNTGLAEALNAERLTNALDAVGVAAGVAREKIQEQVGAISSLGIQGDAAQQSIIKLIQAEADIGNSSKLAAVAQNLAAISGEDLTQTYERLVHAINVGNPRMLRQLNLFIDQKEAMKKYADEIGKTVDQLTQQDRVQATINAVLEAGARIQNVAAESAGSLAANLQRLPTLQKDLAQSVGSGLLPAYGALVSVYKDFVQQLTLGFEEFNATSTVSESLGESIGKIARVVADVVLAFAPLIGLVARVVAGFLEFITSFDRIADGISVLSTVSPVFGAIASGLAAIKSGAFGVTEAVDFIVLAFHQFGVLVAESIATVGDTWNLFNLGVQDAWNATLRFLRRRSDSEFEEIRKDIERQRQAIEQAQAIRREGFGEALSRGNDPRVEEEQRLVAAINLRRDLQRQISEQENAVATARKAQDKEALDAAAKRLGELQKQKTNIESVIRAIKEEKDAQTSLGQARKAATEENARIEAQKKAHKEVRTALEELTAQTEITKDGTKVFSVEGQAALKNLEKVFTDVSTSIKNQSLNEVVTSLTHVRQAILGAFGKLKTLDDFTAFMGLLAQNSALAKEQIAALQTTANFRGQAAALADINNQLQGYLTLTTQVRDAVQSYNQLVTDGLSQQIALQKVAAEVTNNRVAVAALEIRQTSLLVESAKQRLSTEVQLTEEATAKKIELARSSIHNEQALQLALRGIARESTAEQIKQQQSYYAVLKQARDQYLAQFRSSQQEIDTLTKKQRDDQLTTEQSIREIRRARLTDEQRFRDVQLEIEEQVTAAKESAAKKDFAQSEKSIARARQLAQQLASSPAGDPEQNARIAERSLEDIGEVSQRIIGEQKSAAVSVLNQQKSALETTLESLNTVQSKLVELTREQLLQLKFEIDNSALDTTLLISKEKITQAMKDAGVIPIAVDQSSLEAALQKVRDAFSAISIGVSVEAGGGLLNVQNAPQVIGAELTQRVVEGLQPFQADVGQILRRLEDVVQFWRDAASSIVSRQAFAGGGQVRGNSPHSRADNISIWATAGEFMMSVPAVKKYGLDFMHAINLGLFPEMPAFSPVYAPRISYADGGPVTPEPASLGSIDLTANRRPIGRVTGSRETLRKFAQALYEVKRGT